MMTLELSQTLLPIPRFGIISPQQNGRREAVIKERGNTRLMSPATTDWELIQAYLDKGNERAFEQLMSRHYDSVYRRLLSHCKHPDDAADMSQQLWIRVVNNLPNYQDDGKFPSFLMRSTSNMLTDYWRRKGVKDQVIQQTLTEDEADAVELAADQGTDMSGLYEAHNQVTYLTRTLIPELMCEQRLAFLLMHESEHWEEKRRLGWQHLAELNGIDAAQAWRRFEGFRNGLLQSVHGSAGSEQDCDSLLVFLIWTQAQRLEKRQSFTWDYFAEILGVSTNTLKTRYRTALKKLAQGLKDEH